MGRLTFGFFPAKEALCHLSEELLSRAGWVELWYHHTRAGWKFVWSETLPDKLLGNKSQDAMQFRDVPSIPRVE